MSQPLHPFTLEGRACWAVPLGDPAPGAAPVFYCPVEAGEAPLLQSVMDIVSPAVRAGDCAPSLLVAFACADWNRDLTPWPAPILFPKSSPFEGHAPETLDFLLRALMPYAQSALGATTAPAQQGILGYSLAGLFALWAFASADAFRRCGSCSGSLWYDGFLDFFKGRPLPEDSAVYLSLGLSEEKAKNPRMARVGDATRAVAHALQNNPAVMRGTLRWQQGGHFTDVPGRIAQGIIWLSGGDM